MALEQLEDFIREKITQERWTHLRLSEHLKRLHPREKGLSVRSIQTFCTSRGIHKTSRLKDADLDGVVAEALGQVNHYNVSSLVLAISLLSKMHHPKI